MSFFYDRQEDEEKTVIRFTKYPFLLICVLCNAIPWLLAELTGRDALLLFMLPFVAGIFLFSVPYWGVYAEIRQKMKDTGGKVYGSKWSFKNPLTFELPKAKASSTPPPLKN
jgi:hypothetical protein